MPRTLVYVFPLYLLLHNHDLCITLLLHVETVFTWIYNLYICFLNGNTSGNKKFIRKVKVDVF